MAIVCVSLESKLVSIPFLYDCERRIHFLMKYTVDDDTVDVDDDTVDDVACIVTKRYSINIF